MKEYPIMIIQYRLFGIIIIATYSLLFSQSIIKPYSIEWNKLNREKRAAAVKIADNELQSMSTPLLIDKYLTHPFLVDILLAENFQKGFLSFANEFDIVNELLNRSDAATKTIEIYYQMDPSFIQNISSISEQGNYIYRFIHLEILLMQPSIVIQFKGKELESTVYSHSHVKLPVD